MERLKRRGEKEEGGEEIVKAQDVSTSVLSDATWLADLQESAMVPAVLIWSEYRNTERLQRVKFT